MNTCVRNEVTRAASAILEAAQRNDLAVLERWLDNARKLAASELAEVQDDREYLELLEAAATQLYRSIARRKRQATNRLEGAEVPLQLVRHLALQRVPMLKTAGAS